MDIKDAIEQAIPVFELEKNPNEVNNTLLLQNRINTFCENIGLEEEFSNYIKIGYRENVGYYAYIDTDQGLISMLHGFPILDINEAYCIIIRELLTIKGRQSSMIDEKQALKPYVSKKAEDAFYNEYIIQKLNEFYDNNIPAEIVKTIGAQQRQFVRVREVK